MIRVVHVISGLMYGGGQKVALDLLQNVETSGDVKAELWLLGCRHDSLDKRATFIADYSGDYSSPATLLATAKQVRRQLSQAGIDVVHSHGWDADMIGYLATIGRPEARLVHLHVTPAWIFSNRPHHIARRLLTRSILSGRNTEVVAVAGAVLRHWSGAFELQHNSQVIHNSVDAVRFSPRPLQSRADTDGRVPAFGVACRLTPQKGLDVFLNSFSKIPQTIRGSAVVRIAGEGPERARLERMAADLKIAQAVTFHGHVDDVDSFYRELDVMVLPAVSDEGMPLAILEAMASGLAVIATNVGGSAELIRDGVDGIVVSPKDADALSVAMLALLTSAERREKMGASGALRARSEFSPRAQVAAVARVYEKLASARRTRGAQNISEERPV